MSIHTMRILLITVVGVLWLAAVSAEAELLRTTGVKGGVPERSGTYTVILYGGTYFNDPEAAAILDREGDGFTIVARAPSFNYEVKKALPAAKAIEEARTHLGAHRSFVNSSMRAILDRSGNAIGYELLPRYRSFLYGRTNVVDTSYRLADDNTVHAYIRLDPILEDQLLFAGGSGSGGYD